MLVSINQRSQNCKLKKVDFFYNNRYKAAKNSPEEIA
jgi:hypothetical protein